MDFYCCSWPFFLGSPVGVVHVIYVLTVGALCCLGLLVRPGILGMASGVKANGWELPCHPCGAASGVAERLIDTLIFCFP